MFAVGLTDQDWFEYLRDLSSSTTINFWTPTPWNVRRLSSGDKWFFLLKAPIRKLGGYGHFLDYRNMTISQAWDEFGIDNGVVSISELLERCDKYSALHSTYPVKGPNSIIGCIVLKDPVFFDDDALVDPASEGFSIPNEVVKFKYFSDISPVSAVSPNPFSLVASTPTDYSRQRRKDRKGQSEFRRLLLQAYNHRCAITGEPQEKVLEATHIEPYVNKDSNHVQNGILMRVDMHRLFDAGLLAIDSSFRLLVSSRLRGSKYVGLGGQKLLIPKRVSDRPSTLAITWHRDKRFQP